MRRLIRNLALAGALLAARSAAQESSAAVSFRRDVAPLLARKCVTCHGAEKSKGGYRLDTFERLTQAGDSKVDPVVAGKPERSHLYALITAQDEDDRMPQKDEALASEQVAMIQRWLQEGAVFDGPDPRAPLATLIPRPPHSQPPEAYPRPVPITALAFIADGAELAASGYHEVTVWSATDGRLLRRLTNVAERTQGLACQPGGSMLAVAGGAPGQFGEVALFDLRSGSRLKVLAAAPDMTMAIAFNRDGTRLAVGGADNSIRIFDVASGTEQLLIQQHADWVTSLAWNHDGTRIASASRDRSARVYETRAGGLETSYTGHQGPVFAVAFSAEDKLVGSAGRDKRIHFWETGEGKKQGEIAGIPDEIYQLVVLGESVISSGADPQIRQHSVGKKELIRAFTGHTDRVYALAVHEGAKRLAAGSHDGEVRVWNVETGDLTTRFIAAPGYRSEGRGVPASR